MELGYQKALEIFKSMVWEKWEEYNLVIVSIPETIGGTNPFGAGGCAISTTYVTYYIDECNRAIAFCGGRYKILSDVKFELLVDRSQLWRGWSLLPKESSV